MILTVHGSDHKKKQNASNIINDYRRDRQADRLNHVKLCD